MGKYSKVSKQDRKNLVRAVGIASQIGLSMATCVLVGVLLGVFLDDRLGTSPWLVLVFTFLGCLAAFKTLFDIAKKI